MAALLSAGPPAPPPLRPFQPPHPQAQAQAQAPERAGERVQVSLAQVPRWQGSEATHNRRDRRHYGGNKGGRERRLLREFAEPAAAAAAADGADPPPMLRESRNGEDGATRMSVHFFSVSFCPCLPGPLGLDKLPPTSPLCPRTA